MSDLHARTVEALRKARDGFATAPHSLAYDLTRLPEIDAILAEHDAAAQAGRQEAVAYVPVHPRNGPLWSDTYAAGSDVQRAESYPRLALYAAPANDYHLSLLVAAGHITREVADQTVRIAKTAGVSVASRPAGREDARDTARLTWLEENEAHLASHRESFGVDDPECQYSIWWNVVRDGKSVSGHPLGSPREAIDAAIAAAKGG